MSMTREEMREFMLERGMNLVGSHADTMIDAVLALVERKVAAEKRSIHERIRATMMHESVRNVPIPAALWHLMRNLEHETGDNPIGLTAPQPGEQKGERMTKWRVTFESPGAMWAAQHEGVRDFTALWDTIPWKPTVSRETHDEASARSQYDQLLAWERSKEQPIRNVKLSVGEDVQWRDA